MKICECQTYAHLFKRIEWILKFLLQNEKPQLEIDQVHKDYTPKKI